MKLVGIISVFLSVAIIYIGWKQPVEIWNMRKVFELRRNIGDKGSIIFFFILGIILSIFGIWSIMK